MIELNPLTPIVPICAPPFPWQGFHPLAVGTVTGSHTYTDAGMYSVEVCVTDDDGAEACDTFQVEVQLVPATVDCDPDTLNLKGGRGVITCYIELPEGFDVAHIDTSTVQCQGAFALRGMLSEEDSRTYVAKFSRHDLPDLPVGDAVLLIKGEVRHNGNPVDFEGSDTISVIR